MSEVAINYKGSDIATMNASGTKTLQTSGKYCEDDITVTYARPSVTPTLETVTKTYTPSTTAITDTITPSSGYDGIDEVDVTVSAVPTGSATPASSISATGATVSTSGSNTLTLSKSSVSNTPTVSAGYISSGTAGNSSVSLSATVNLRSSLDLTASGATVTAPSGYYSSNASKSVASGTEGTPTATKGAVNNHTIDVTPSVTNSAGYISGGTHSGTAVSVSASELVSGSETKTANGTYDVTDLAELVVNVAGGSGLEYETGTYTPTSDIARPTISWSKTHTEAPVLVFLCDVTGTAHSTANSNYVFMYADPYKLWGHGFPYTSSGYRYANVWYCYRGTSTSYLSTGGLTTSNNSDSTSTNGASYPRYWVSPTDFHPYTNSTSRYWRKDRTYKWIAVWKPTT